MPSDASLDMAVVLLAGGQARRMGGGDKCLRLLAGKPLLSHVLDRIRPQASTIVLNVNGDPHRFAAFNLPIVADSIPGFAGPLAGVLAAMEWVAQHAPACRWLVSAPTDSPMLPRDLVPRLRAAVDHGALLACAASGGRTHPVAGIWPIVLAADLRQALVVEDERKIDRFTARYALAAVEWSDQPIDPFFNANRLEDLSIAERLLGQC